MSDGNILSAFNALAGPGGSSVEMVDRPCQLRGWWAVPHASSDLDFEWYDGDPSSGGTVVFVYEVRANLSHFGFSLPGNGIRFDESLWFKAYGSGAHMKSLTVFYS